ncbi:MAG: hypothetical protein JNK45_25255, partial [Myxococcales bacterium]|nr:hypothetical protein [Myxococcales bacterium]
MARIRVLLAVLVATFLLVGMTLGGGEAEASQWAPEFGEDLDEGEPSGPGG